MGLTEFSNIHHPDLGCTVVKFPPGHPHHGESNGFGKGILEDDFGHRVFGRLFNHPDQRTFADFERGEIFVFAGMCLKVPDWEGRTQGLLWSDSIWHRASFSAVSIIGICTVFLS